MLLVGLSTLNFLSLSHFSNPIHSEMQSSLFTIIFSSINGLMIDLAQKKIGIAITIQILFILININTLLDPRHQRRYLF
jgi:hypothetical protein